MITANLMENSIAAGNSGQDARRFALIGAAGFVAPKHLEAIQQTGNQLVAATDPHDSVGQLDHFFPDAKFFTEIERFDRFLEKQRRESPIDYICICSPNYLHDAHVRLALRVKAHAICEKPLVINPWNLDQLQDLEQEHGSRIYTVLQMRLLPAIQRLKERLAKEATSTRREVCLTYVTRRGAWYHASWKGTEEKSGGLAMNIGVHFFDVLLMLFGHAGRNQVHLNTKTRMSGLLELEKARVRWFLSVDRDDLPDQVKQQNGHAFRSLSIDGEEIDMSHGFHNLHTDMYRRILAGEGFGIEDARPAIETVYAIRNSREVTAHGVAHPLFQRISH